jgi:predicted HAD superfamily Cof-like phosphohydrolase
MNIDDAVVAVTDFHMGTGSPVADRPRLLPGDRLAAATLAGQLSSLISGIATADDNVLLQRAAMAIEELAEWLQAHADGDLVAAADAWADRAYVLLGDAAASGLPAAELFAEVHRSNMTKDLVADGTGKATKGANYRPPNLAAILESASNDR